jgi:hypothetical protein
MQGVRVSENFIRSYSYRNARIAKWRNHGALAVPDGIFLRSIELRSQR